MPGYKNYRKNKLKKYQRGGEVRGQAAGPTRIGRRATDSPYGTAPGTPNYPGGLFPKGYEFNWMDRRGAAQGGPQAPNMPGGIDYSSVYPWNPPDASTYKKGGKVMEQYKKGGKVSDKQVIKLLTKYLETKKNPKVRTGRKKHKGVGDWFPENEKKTEDFKAMTMRTQSLRKMLPEKKLAKRAKVKTKKKTGFAKGGRVTKEGGIELIRSMRGMSLRELMDLNKKMVRG